MIRMLWNVFAVLLLIHVLGAAGLAGWLYTSGRLDGDRLQAAVAVFETTIQAEQEEQEEQEKADELAIRTQQVAARQQWLTSVSDGPRPNRDRLNEREQEEQLSRQQTERFERDRQALLDAMANYRKQIEGLQKQLVAQRLEFERRLEEQAKKKDDEGFRKAVQLYAQSKPKQVKQMFMDLVARGQVDRVIEYLSAIPPRQAAAVLKQFKQPEEVTLATRLIEGLRSASGGAGGGEAANKGVN
ncbi:MAG: hypothetical protein CMJ18_20835 [Phycisphaeraceae bacterium]|nr:hypothetical protein [Phycisphaeraceae bacterium]